MTVGDTHSSVSAGQTWANASDGPSVQVNDPELAPSYLTSNIADGRLTVTFVPPDLDGAEVYLVDHTDPGNPVALTQPQPAEIEGDAPPSIEIVSSELHGDRCFRLVGIDSTATRHGVSDQFCVKFP